MQTVEWSQTIGKEAERKVGKGQGDPDDLGEIQEIGQHYVVTQRGITNKEKFYIPKYVAYGFDGKIVWFDITDSDLVRFKRDAPERIDIYLEYKPSQLEVDLEKVVPFVHRSRSDID